MVFQMLLVAVPASISSASNEQNPSRGSLRVNARAAKSRKPLEKLVPASRASYVTSAGDSIFQMVAPADSLGKNNLRKGFGYFFFLFVVLGVIPAGLLIITGVWSFAQLMKKFMPTVFQKDAPPTATET